MTDYQGCPMFEAEGRRIDELVELARGAEESLDPGCLTMLDAYSREEGLFDGAPKGIQGEANKVAGGNFFWAAPPQAIRYGELRDATTEGDLLTTGALGMGLDDGFLKKFLEHAVKAKGPSVEKPVEIVGPLEAARGIVSLKECNGGLELYAFDLKAFGKASGCTRDLVVFVPSKIGGVPIVRMHKDAFARRYVQGIDVALFILPEHIEDIPEGALSCISARCIRLGRSVSLMRPQPCDLGLFSPKLKERRYVVDPENRFLAARDGALTSADGSVLHYLEPPYGDEVHLPSGTKSIEAHAFCTGTPQPTRVLFPSSLESHVAGAFDRAVWVGEASPRLAASFVRDGIRSASPGSLQEGECLYDVLDDGSAALVAGPPPAMSASQRFAAERMLKVDETARATGNAHVVASGTEAKVLNVPAEVHGHPVSSIAKHALHYAPETLQIPGSVIEVADGNAAKGVKHIAIAQGVRRIGSDCFVSRTFEDVVDIPESVESIGSGSFLYALCRFAQTGVILHVPADNLKSPFGRSGASEQPFDIEAYDQALVDDANVRDRLGARLHRLAMPFPLGDAARRHVIGYIESRIDEALSYAAREGSNEVIDALIVAGLAEGSRLDQLIELLRSSNRMECVMRLMHANAATQGQSSRDRFSL